MKKNLLLGFLSLAIVFSFASMVKAESSAVKAMTDAELKAKIKLSTEAQLGGAQKVEMRKKFGERMEIGVKKHIENNFLRFEAVYNRLVRLADRIDSRLSKLKADGIDVSVSAKYLAAAEVDLAEAKTAIDSLKTSWNDILNVEADVTVDNSVFEKCKANGGTILKTFPAKCQLGGETYADLSVSLVTRIDNSNEGRFAKLRALAKKAKEELKSAHANMVSAIKSIKPGQNKVEVKSTNEVEISN